MSTTCLYDVNSNRPAFARVCTDNPSLGISGHKCSYVPGPFSDAEIAEYTPMFARCVAWIRAFHSVAPGFNVESDLARDCQMTWQKLHGDRGHIAHGIFIAGAYHLGLASPRRRGRPDTFVQLRLAVVWDALDAWQGINGELGHPLLKDLEKALEKAR